jgi:NAD-dependent DNA ligase
MITKDQGLQIIKNISILGMDEVAITDVISLLELADDLYFNDEDPILEDSGYDAIYRYAKLSAPTDAYFLGIGSSVRGGKINLPFTMGSLDQIHEGEIQAWLKKWCLHNHVGVISDKLDGASGMVIYDTAGKFQIAYSRGDGVQGADISRHLIQMSSVPKSIMTAGEPFVVRGENIISIANFKRIQSVVKTSAGKMYKNPRNCVSGLMNASSNDKHVYNFIDFIAYEIVGSPLSKLDQFSLLLDLGFTIPHRETTNFRDIDDNTLSSIVTNRKRLSDYELDGIVIDVNAAEKRSEMNPTRSTLNPAFTFKYKVSDDSNYAEVVVRDVTFSISKHGYLKPTIQLTPTELVGVTISNCTGFNASFIKDNKIGPGAVIGLVRSGDVIPFCTKVIQPMPVEIYDDWFFEKVRLFGKVHWTTNLVGDNVDLVLDDANLDPTVKYEQLVDFFDTIGAPHLGEGNLQKIFEMGFETPESVINLTQEDLSSILNSTIMGKKIFAGLREKLTNIPLYKLMGAYPSFGRGVGVRRMKLLYDAFAGDMSLCGQYSKIVDVSGFEDKTAKKISLGYPAFVDFIFEVKHAISLAKYEAPKVGKFTDIAVVFTGFRDKSLESQIVEQGGKIGSAVSSKTGLVVTPDPDGSSGKLKKARELNIQIINIDTLKSLLVK